MFKIKNSDTSQSNEDLYRIGWNNEQECVTLTVRNEDEQSMTLSLSPTECERMIRMIRSTYESEPFVRRETLNPKSYRKSDQCIVCGDTHGRGMPCPVFGAKSL